MYKIIKPPFQELSGEELLGATANRDSGAWLDVVADGFWGTSRERSYFDVRVSIHTQSQTNNPHSHQLTDSMRKIRRGFTYSVSVMWNTACFPTSTGGMGKEASIFYKRMASLLSEKHGQTYSTTMAWLRCVLSFSLLRSSILCFRGHRSAVGRPSKTTPLLPVDAIRAERSWSLLN